MLGRRQLLLSGLTSLTACGSQARAQEELEEPQMLPSGIAPVLVAIPPGYPPGEIHVDPDHFALFWTLPDNTAIRYACGIGRPGLYEPGEFHIGAKKEWPSWTPTPDMIAREPELYGPYAGGLPGGPDNPLGARALYLFTPERGDTFLRIHGTNAPATIGTAVPNGCARLINEQMIDLYERVPRNTRVVLYTPSWSEL